MDFVELIRFKGFRFHHTLTEHPDPENFTRHCHNMYELIYIRQGQGEFQVEGNTYSLYPGCFLVFMPQEFHCIRVREDTPYERFVVHFNREQIFENQETLLAIFRNRALGINNLFADYNEIVPNTMQRIASCSELSEPERSTMAKLILNELLVLLYGNFYISNENVTAKKLINRIIAYINEHLSETLRLSELAERFFISPTYLSHMFKRHTGLTITEYITGKRLSMAQGMIRKGETAIAAANACGYNDYSAFFRAYTRVYGKSPSSETKEQN